MKTSRHRITQISITFAAFRSGFQIWLEFPLVWEMLFVSLTGSRIPGGFHPSDALRVTWKRRKARTRVWWAS